VLGVFRALAELRPAINVVGIIPACENMPDGRAVKPGDVVTSMSGQTIEILNTDAEGRLVLCDALTYVARFKPRAVVDIATLTGACVVALGGLRSGLFSTDEALAQALQSAGDAAQDLCWRMPLDEEYAEGLKSNFADVGNVAGRAGGAVTAAKFLQRFVGDLPWAHLDIAGTAWKSGAAKGSTGRPVGLLVHYLLDAAKAAPVKAKAAKAEKTVKAAKVTKPVAAAEAVNAPGAPASAKAPKAATGPLL
jgi:leucyl aminopeptidase